MRPPTKDDGTASETRDKVISNNLADTTCSGIDGRISITNQYNNAVDRYKKSLAKLKSSTTDKSQDAAELELKSARDDLTKSRLLIQALDDPNSEEAKALQDQTIDEFNNSEKIQQAVDNRSAAKSLGITSKVAGDKTIIPISTVRNLSVEGSSEESKRITAHIINSDAARQVLKGKYVTGTQADDTEYSLEQEFKQAKDDADSRRKVRNSKDREKDIEVITE